MESKIKSSLFPLITILLCFCCCCNGTTVKGNSEYTSSDVFDSGNEAKSRNGNFFKGIVETSTTKTESRIEPLPGISSSPSTSFITAPPPNTELPEIAVTFQSVSSEAMFAGDLTTLRTLEQKTVAFLDANLQTAFNDDGNSYAMFSHVVIQASLSQDQSNRRNLADTTSRKYLLNGFIYFHDNVVPSRSHISNALFKTLQDNGNTNISGMKYFQVVKDSFDDVWWDDATGLVITIAGVEEAIVGDAQDTSKPSIVQSFLPSSSHTDVPTRKLSHVPSQKASDRPSRSPQASPSIIPSVVATFPPSILFSETPSVTLSAPPSVTLSASPSVVASVPPSVTLSASPSAVASAPTSVLFSKTPSVALSAPPSAVSSIVPSASQSFAPSASSISTSSATPSLSTLRSSLPSVSPIAVHSVLPSNTRSTQPSLLMSDMPSILSTMPPSILASEIPSISSSLVPSNSPSLSPSSTGTGNPTFSRSFPSIVPSTLPTIGKITAGAEEVDVPHKANRDPSSKSFVGVAAGVPIAVVLCLAFFAGYFYRDKFVSFTKKSTADSDSNLSKDDVESKDDNAKLVWDETGFALVHDKQRDPSRVSFDMKENTILNPSFDSNEESSSESLEESEDDDVSLNKIEIIHPMEEIPLDSDGFDAGDAIYSSKYDERGVDEESQRSK